MTEMTKGISMRIYSDYVCPYCFLQEGPLCAAVERVRQKKRVDINVQWMPFELRPEPTPTLRPEENYLQTAWAKSVYPMARRMAVEIALPSVSPQPYSRLAFEGFLFAQKRGKHQEYNHAVFRAFFQENRDIGQVEVLCTIAAAVGLDDREFATALKSGAHRDEHARLLRHAVEEVGITSVPTAFVGDIPLVGVRSQAELEEVLTQVCVQQ